MKIEIGTWVRFWRGGVLVIGVVLYGQISPFYDPEAILVTDLGEVKMHKILEAR